MTKRLSSLRASLTGTAAVALALASTATPSLAQAETSADVVPAFAFIAADLSDFGQAQVEGIESIVNPLGGTVTTLDGANTDDELNRICNDAITSGRYNGLILNPVSAPGAIPCVEAAREAGIPVATVEAVAGPDSSQVEPQLEGVIVAAGTSNRAYGAQIAQNLMTVCAEFNPCNYIHIYGFRGYQLSEDIHASVQEFVGGDPKYVEVAAGEDHFNPTDARQVVADLIAANPQTNVILNSSDSSAVQVAILLEEIGRQDIKVLGDGGSRRGLAGVADGTIAATVVMRPFSYGAVAAENLVNYLTGQDVMTPKEVQERVAPFIVTKENVAGLEGEWG